MFRLIVYLVSQLYSKQSGGISLHRKNGTELCRILYNAKSNAYYIDWLDGSCLQPIGPKSGILIGCHAIEIDCANGQMVVRIPNNSGFWIMGCIGPGFTSRMIGPYKV